MAEEKQKENTQTEKTEAHKGGNGKELNLIVRIAGIDLDGKKPVYRALTKIQGIGHRTAKSIAIAFEKQAGIKYDAQLGELMEENQKRLEKIVTDPVAAGIPVWKTNRQKDYETGENRHLVMGELQFSVRQDTQRLGKIKVYRGIRHQLRLPLRGQKTKSTHRGKGIVVGVMKKDAKAAKKGAAKTPDAGEKKK